MEMTEFEKQMLAESKKQTAYLSVIKVLILVVTIVVAFGVGALIAK